MAAAGEYLPQLVAVYRGSDGDATKALYTRLERLGEFGAIAINLFRAQKASERAKAYRGGDGKGRFRDQAYDRKQWSVDNLCLALSVAAHRVGLSWGWGEDPNQPFHNQVLYIDLPTGQVSFHSAVRGRGPSYDGKWDGYSGVAVDRILRWIARLLAEAGEMEAV